MRIISSDYVFPVVEPPIKDGFILIDDDGQIAKTGTKQSIQSKNLEYYPGFLVPGFINCHCHLELSYLKGIIRPSTGLQDFIANIIRKKKEKPSQAEVINAMHLANQEIRESGTAAVGDISNSDVSFSIKKSSSIFYHTFIEIIGSDESDAEEKFNAGLKLLSQARSKKIQASLTFHAPYSTNIILQKKILNHGLINESLLSLHNHESLDEDALFNTFNIIQNELIRTDYSEVIKELFESFYKNIKLLLVHNIYTAPDEFRFLSKEFPAIFWTLCPNSNLSIEKRLPDIVSLSKIAGNKITIGTDSLASNKSLSMIEEIKTILNHNQYLSFNEVLSWATINGARALGIDKKYGSFETGKTPGIVLLQNVDIKSLSIQENCVSKLIV